MTLQKPDLRILTVWRIRLLVTAVPLQRLLPIFPSTVPGPGGCSARPGSRHSSIFT